MESQRGRMYRLSALLGVAALVVRLRAAAVR